MKIHYSMYEEAQGWIPVSGDNLPEIRKKVRVCSITMHDWNLEEMLWESTGKLRNTDRVPSSWVLMASDLIKYNKLNGLYVVTHWKEIES